jgi:uridine kinase
MPDLVSVALDQRAGRAEFRASPVNAAIGQTLEAMGFESSNGLFVRRFPDSPDVPAIFERFSSDIDEMILQKQRARPAPWDRTLDVVATRLTGEVDWWLAGSAALAIRGIDCRPRDVDIVVDDARRTGRLLEDLLVEPVRPMVGWVAGWFGRAFAGALIEWVADVHSDDPRTGSDPKSADPAARLEAVTWRGHTILSSTFLTGVAQRIRAKPAPEGMSTKIISVDGPGGAGKSSLAERLAKELDDAQIVHTDDFASWDNPLDWWPRLIEEALEPLSQNKPGRYRRTDWGNPDHEEWGEVTPAAFVILEGVSASREAFQPFLTYSIWIETPLDVRLKRGLERDGEEARAQWKKWMAEEDDYVDREKPRERADLVLAGDQDLWN